MVVAAAIIGNRGLAVGGDRPDILLILADDLAWSDLACYGHPFHRTPNLDRLARDGMRFTAAYSPAPICSAARASILTGQSVPRTGFEFVTKSGVVRQPVTVLNPMRTPPFTLNLDPDHTTIAEVLSPAGYATHFYGKWHVSEHYRGRYLAWHPKYGPTTQGFQIAEEDFGDHPYAYQNRPPPPDLKPGTYPNDSLINRIAAAIKPSTEHPHPPPKFIFASLFHVHTPVKNRCKWLESYYDDVIPKDSPARARRIRYAAFVETLDHHVGTLLSAIHQGSADDPPLVVFTSDNGGHPQFADNTPLRGSKWNLYEGGIRVPMIVRWPGVVPADSVCDTPVIGYDLLPTFADIADAATVDHDIDGKSLLGLLRGNCDADDALGDRPLVWHFPYYHPETNFAAAPSPIGVGDFVTSRTTPHSALRDGPWKVIRFDETGTIELYHLVDDVAEQNDRSRSHPEIARRMTRRLNECLDRFNARPAIPPGNPERAAIPPDR